MKTCVSLFFSVLFFFSGVSNAEETAVETTPEAVAKIAATTKFKVGDTWRISVRNSITDKELYQQDESVTKIENGVVHYKIGNYSSATSTLDGYRTSFVNPRKGEEYLYEPPAQGSGYPLMSVGQTWKVPYRAKINGNITLEGETEMKIVSFGKKEFPAGNFYAFEIEAVTNFVGNGPGWTYQGKYVVTSWYAPEVKGVAKRVFVKYINGRVDFNETMFVMKFTPGE